MGLVKVKAIRSGERYSATVEGGVAQRRAIVDGIVVVMDDRDVVIEAVVAAQLLRDLGWEMVIPRAPRVNGRRK
jgi:hypothetical protein